MALQSLRRVVVVGGTHGNENNGVFLIQSYLRNNNASELCRPSFESVQVLMGNPAAVARVSRFCDEDLNRQFTVEKLRDYSNSSYESARAKALNALLGPKPGSFDPPGAPLPKGSAADEGAVDLVIDLHTTTGNMGCCLMVSTELGLFAACYARAWLDTHGMPCKIFYTPPSIPRAHKGNLGSCAKHNITVECGPTPNGLVRFDIVSWMHESIKRILDCVDCLNRGLRPQMPPAGSQWGDGWARGDAHDAWGMPTRVVVLRSATDKKDMMRREIPMPCDDDGKPSMMFAPQLQDHDFQPLRVGDPMFVGLGGEVVRYDGSFGEVVYPYFVNEAGYYFASSGFGFSVAVEEEISLHRPTMATAALPLVAARL